VIAGRRPEAGFTLAEMAIVIVIISILLLGVLKGEALLTSGKVQDVIALAKDMSIAVADFKQRYHLFPGDLPIDATTPAIPGIRAECVSGGANVGDGNGVISVTESACVPEVLLKIGVGKANLDSSGWYVFSTTYGPARVMAAGVSSVPALVRPSVVNVILFERLPCAVALEVDRKIDDGNLSTGKSAASVATCTPGGTNDPVPFFAVAL
jgi:prepilin-type N-terminal cleavage/methylation domain-containing protein